MGLDTSTAFYDVMFDIKQDKQLINLLEEKALAQVRLVLNNPERLSKHIPTLPTMLIKLLETLKNPNSDVFDFVNIIEQDPAFAAEVLRIANSARYCQSNQEVCSLRRAVSLLGLAGLSKIATTLLMADVIPSKPIYYKMFGRQIWLHSMHCATLCELLADSFGEDDFDGYFIGLIHDVGKIIIFTCLCEALSMVMIDCVPGSQPFKKLMSEMSLDISYFIAKEWQLPKIYCEALAVQSKSIQTQQYQTLAALLFKANKLSEAYLLYNRKMITDEKMEQLLVSLSVDDNSWQKFCQLAVEIEQSVG